MDLHAWLRMALALVMLITGLELLRGADNSIRAEISWAANAAARAASTHPVPVVQKQFFR